MKDSDKAYSEIRRMIVLTDLKPGQEIVIGDLMKKLSLGKTPVREALNRLSYEGYIRILPRKGILVSSLNVDDLDKLKDLRLYFVKFLSEQIVQNSGIEEIKRIREIQKNLSDQEETFHNLLMADLGFHELTFELCNNKYAEELMKNNLYLSVRLMIIKKEVGVTLQSIIKDYDVLAECIKNKDSKCLENLLMNHILEVKDNKR